MKSLLGVLILLCCLMQGKSFAHSGHHDAGIPLHQWTVEGCNVGVRASLLMFKDGEVYLEQADHAVVHYPFACFSTKDQVFVAKLYWKIASLNRPLRPAVDAKTTTTTDPLWMDEAFNPFKPDVATHWDATYFYVESRGIPDHQMMVGITNWQQQVPIPQCYTGNNPWSIPLNPIIAANPVPVNNQHFLRGAIAIAVNGVPIFNPYTNTGVDAYLDGQLDNWGGHCGRADDYHYHIAPLTLYSQTADTLPIAFALDGFAVYGAKEPDGMAMTTLDANHGHYYGTGNVYHYHGTATAPYMIGSMVGEVMEDNTLQIIPQASASPIRAARQPLPGAEITDFQSIGTNGYALEYMQNNLAYGINYSWSPAGDYEFYYVHNTGTLDSIYHGFAPCTVPLAVDDMMANDNGMSIFPNPTHGTFQISFRNPLQSTQVKSLRIYSATGQLLQTLSGYHGPIALPDLPQGSYFISVQVSGSQSTLHLVIQ